jgi:hypothetical protein
LIAAKHFFSPAAPHWASLWDYLQEARRKEGGLDPAMISFILARTHIDAIPDYILEPVSVEELVAFVRDLQRRLSEMAFPEMPS